MFNRLTLPLTFGLALTVALGNQDSEDSALERDPLVLTYLANSQTLSNSEVEKLRDLVRGFEKRDEEE